MAKWIAETAHQQPHIDNEAFASLGDLAAGKVAELKPRELHDLLRFARPASLVVGVDALDPWMDEEELEETTAGEILVQLAARVLEDEALHYFDDPSVTPSIKATSAANLRGRKASRPGRGPPRES